MYFKALLVCIFLLGVTHASNDNRIVNGTDAPEGKYPFQVEYYTENRISVQYYGSHICGGSILSSEFVLTAAHCAAGSYPKSLTVIAGSIHLFEGIPYQVTEIFVHEAFNFSAALNDIAIVRVSPPFDFNNNNELLGPVSLPEQYEQTFADKIGTVIGWGINATSGSLQTILQEVEIFVYCDEECFDIHGIRINPKNICAGVRGGGKGHCNGDSGGPLLVDGKQVGIISWAKEPCTIAPYPGVFTQISPFVDWIKSKINVE